MLLDQIQNVMSFLLSVWQKNNCISSKTELTYFGGMGTKRLTSRSKTQRPVYLALQEEEDSSLDQAAVEALPAPPG